MSSLNNHVEESDGGSKEGDSISKGGYEDYTSESIEVNEDSLPEDEVMSCGSAKRLPPDGERASKDAVERPYMGTIRSKGITRLLLLGALDIIQAYIYGVDRTVLLRSHRLQENNGKLAIFKGCSARSSSASVENGENDQEDEQQKQAEEVMSKKVVEKLVSSKKAKQVAVESELIPVDNDAPASADEEGAETVIKKVDGGNKRKKDVNEDNKVDGKLVSFKKVKQVADGSELVLVDNEKEGCKYDPVKINTRMSPVHLKNVLNTCTLPQIMDLNEMGLGHFHNNFNFESTPGELGMWVVKSYDPETHTLRMGDGRRIKVSRELIHEILGVPMGENKVISLPSTTSEDITTTNWRYTTPFIEDRIHITRVDDHVCSLTANGWPFKVGFLVVFFSILAQGNKDGRVNQRFIPTLSNIDEFQNYDWCQFILDCIKDEVLEFKPRSYFAGPLLLLALIYVSSTVSPTTTVERKAPIFKAWSTKLLKKRESEELKSEGFGKLPILEGLEFIEPKKPKLKKKKSKVLLLGDGSMSREQELEEFKTKTAKIVLNDNVSKIKALLLDTDKKLKISLNENLEDSDLKMILEKRLGFFKELYHRDVDNAMVVSIKCNDPPDEAVNIKQEMNKEKDVEKVVDQNLDKHEVVKDNKVSNEIDDIPEKGKDVKKEMNKEKDVEKVVHQDLDKPEDIEKEGEFGNNEVEKNTKDLIKGADVCVEISKKEVSKGVLAIYEEPLKDSESQTSIFDNQPEDSQHETQDSQPGMEIGAGIQEENHEPVKNCETLEEADFPSIGLEDIESLKGAGRNLFAEKTTVQNVNEDDMILQDSLLNLPFLSTQEVSCLEIDTQKSPQIQKQGLQEESPQIQKQGIPKYFHSNKLKLPKYVSPDAQAIVEKRQEDMLTETRIFRGKETKTFDSINSKLVKKNDRMAQCMKEKSIDEEKGKSDDFKGGHPTVKRKQIKKAIEGEKNVPKTQTKAKTIKPAPTKRKKKEPNDKEETAIHASPISFIPPPVDIESEKRQGKPSNFLVSPFYQRKVILHEPVSEEGKKIVEYIWSDNTPEGDKLSGDGNVYCHTVMMTHHSVEIGKDLEARRKILDENIDIVLKQAKRKNFDDVNLRESFIDYLERKKYQNCYDLILAKPKQIKFSWKTTYNSNDCGIFVMRHMETYLGKGNFLQELKKEGPGQKVQLNMLCAKYMSPRTLVAIGEGMDHKKPGFELRISTMEENGSYVSKCTCTPSFSSSGLQGFNLSLDYYSWNLLGNS
ncbi:hypothetical protein Tco_0795091 [Tanacetum coccineum]